MAFIHWLIGTLAGTAIGMALAFLIMGVLEMFMQYQITPLGYRLASWRADRKGARR